MTAWSTLRQLRYLQALVQYRHFGRAAEACAVSQPALSMQIRDLEKELGVELVERRPGEAALTDIGLEVARRGERVLAATRDLVDFARHRGRVLSGRLKLGIIPTLAPYVLPKVLPDSAGALSGIDRRTARDADQSPDRRTRRRRARRGDAGAAAAGCRDRNHRGCSTIAFLLAVPAGDPLPQQRARQSARDRSAAPDPARRRPLPARSGAGLLRDGAARNAASASAPPASRR